MLVNELERYYYAIQHCVFEFPVEPSGPAEL